MKIVKSARRSCFAGCSLALGLGAARADDTLFQDLGGRDAIVKIASDTTDNFLADEPHQGDLRQPNMDRFRRLLGSSLPGRRRGVRHTGRNMHDSHKGLHLTNADFNAVVEDLQKAMDKGRRPPSPRKTASSRALAPMQHGHCGRSDP